MLKKVIAYIRYSSHAQDDGNSVPAQINCITDYAETHNMEIENYYIDTAKTGRNTKRPEYQKMKQDIENGNVEAKIILVRAIDRLHRNAKNQLEDVEWCEKYGIRIIGIIDGTDTADSNNKFILTIKAATAEEYSNTLSKTTKAGQQVAANECKHLGGIPPLGYKVNSEGKYEIDERTAPIIRDIFKLYLQDIGYNKIIDYLKAKGYKTAMGNDFKKSSLNAILRNQKYMGTYTFDRTMPKDSEGKRNSHKTKENYIKIENGMPAIISAEDFGKVRTKMQENANRNTQRASRNYYALKGKVKCAKCGKAVTGDVNHSKGKRYLQYRFTCHCGHKTIPMKRLNDLTFYAVQQCLFNSGNKEKMLHLVNEKLQLKAHQKSAEIAEIQNRINRLNQAQEHLLVSLEMGYADETIMNKMSRNEKELKELTAQLENMAKEVSDIDDSTYNELVKRFTDYMNANMTSQAIDLRNAVIDHVAIGSNKTTIYFNCGVEIDDEAKLYFNQEVS